MKELIRNRNGTISTIVLVLMPLFIIAMVGVTEVARSTYSSSDLQGALDSAVRASASCVDELSQANDDIRIDPIEADAAFRYELSRNLGLDESTLTPLANSGIAESPAYQLVIINGTNPYVSEGYVITYDGGYSTVDILTGSLPVNCGVSDSGVDVGGVGTYQTTLNAPGCVAVVKAKTKAVMSSDYENVRWAAARIKTS